jgi:hypothetical protein
MVNLKLLMFAIAAAAPLRLGPVSVEVPVALVGGVDVSALGALEAAGDGVADPPEHPEKAMATTAVRISRPRPGRGATWNTSTSAHPWRPMGSVWRHGHGTSECSIRNRRLRDQGITMPGHSPNRKTDMATVPSRRVGM